MKKIVSWHANKAKKEIEQGKPTQCVKVDLSLTHTKFTHTLWLKYTKLLYSGHFSIAETFLGTD